MAGHACPQLSSACGPSQSTPVQPTFVLEGEDDSLPLLEGVNGMLHSEALQVPGTVQDLEGRQKVQPGQEPDPPSPGIPAPRTAPPAPTPQLLQLHLPPLPELLLHQGADTKLLVHLLQQLGLWDREGVTSDLRLFRISRRCGALLNVSAKSTGLGGTLLKTQRRHY